ncbi:mCG144962, partial [Mus musculus]
HSNDSWNAGRTEVDMLLNRALKLKRLVSDRTEKGILTSKKEPINYSPPAFFDMKTAMRTLPVFMCQEIIA